jgi:mannose-6-phosphate isomerase class I
VVDEIRLVDHSFDRTTGASFHLLAVVRGTLEVQWEGGREQASQGEVVCVAAQWGGYRLQAVDGPSALLRVALQGPG